MKTLFRSRSWLLGPVAIVLSTSALTQDAWAENRWLLGSVDNFEVYSNSSKGETSRIITELREVKAIVTRMFPDLVSKKTLPLRVFICKNDATVRRYAPLYEGKPQTLTGLFTQDLEGDLILVNAGRPIQVLRETVYHEYMHYINSGLGFYLPPWLSEGLAEIYSTIRFSESEAEIGRADLRHSDNLQDKRLIPLERLFGVTKVSPE